jgi:hypothetical protein
MVAGMIVDIIERERIMEKVQAREFYKEQLDYLLARDVDGLIDNHYREDALLIGFDFVVKGRASLKAHFRTYLHTLGHLEVKTTNKFSQTEDTLFFEASVVSDLGPAEVYDAMVLQDGKIAYHFTGVK